jgi:DNA repair exonuclease SbcCD ATPase subunit
MKILSFQAENIKRLVAVDITPHGQVVELTGRNGQGKTSILDAIQWALDTNKVVQSKPVRDGADSGYVRLDLGEYIVTKRFKVKDGQEVGITLTVQNRDGAKYGSPQELLKGFYGTFTFDPLAFAEMKQRDQVIALRSLVPGYDFAAADRENDADYDARTEVNRAIRSLQERIAVIKVPEGTPDEPISIAALMEEFDKGMRLNSDVERQRSDRMRDRAMIDRLNDEQVARAGQIADLERRIADLRAQNLAAEQQVADIAKRIADAGDMPEVQDLEPIRQRISAAEETNRNVNVAKGRASMVEELRAKEAESAALTKAIDDRKEAAARAVRGAKLPIAGLELTPESALLNGIPLDQASDAQQLRLSIAVAAAMSPKLRIARVRDGSKLDTASMAALTSYAEENDIQLWVETVESGRPTAIVIEDGMIAGQLEAAE